MVELSVLNIKIRISFLFVAMLSLLSLADKSGCVFLSIVFSLLHEMGHITAMAICKEPIDSLAFHPFGISMKLKTSSALSFGEELFVLLSGCVTNLVFIILPTSQTVTYINIGIFLFNIFPIANLDGGRTVRLLLTRFFGERKGNIVSDAVSFALLLPLSAFAFYTVARSGQFSLLVCSLYLTIIMIFKRDKLS